MHILNMNDKIRERKMHETQINKSIKYIHICFKSIFI